MSKPQKSTPPFGVCSTVKLCPDNWGEVLDDPTPQAVRWASRRTHMETNWSKWHYSEGNFRLTACGNHIIPFLVDGSPEEADLERVDCRKCLSAMRHNADITSG